MTVSQEVMDEKGVELAIECLVRHKFVPSVQSEGCRFLEVPATRDIARSCLPKASRDVRH